MSYKRRNSSSKRKKTTVDLFKTPKGKRGPKPKDPIGLGRLFKTPKKHMSKRKRKSTKRKRSKKLSKKLRKSRSYRSPASIYSKITLDPEMARMMSIPTKYRSLGGRAHLTPNMRRQFEEAQLRKEISRLEKGQLAGMKGFGGKLSKKQKSSARFKPLTKHYTPRLQLLQQEIALLRNDLRQLKQQLTKRKTKKSNKKSPSKRRIVPQPVARRIVPQFIG